MRVITMRLGALTLVEVIVLLLLSDWMLMHLHARLGSLILHANCRVEGGARLNIQNRVLNVGSFWRPRVLRISLVLRNWTASVVNGRRKHDWFLKILCGLLLLLRGRLHVTPIQGAICSLCHRCRLRHPLWIRQLLLLSLTLFLSLLILIYLSVLTTTIRHLQICCAHIRSPTVYMTHLHSSNEQTWHFLVIVTHKAKSSTSFSQWITNDLIFFDLAELLEMLFKALISEIVV